MDVDVQVCKGVFSFFAQPVLNIWALLQFLQAYCAGWHHSIHIGPITGHRRPQWQNAMIGIPALLCSEHPALS